MLLLMMTMITMVIYCHHLNTRYALLLVVVSFRRMMISAICRKSLTNWTKLFIQARVKRIKFCFIYAAQNGTELSSILIFSPSPSYCSTEWHNSFSAYRCGIMRYQTKSMFLRAPCSRSFVHKFQNYVLTSTRYTPLLHSLVVGPTTTLFVIALLRWTSSKTSTVLYSTYVIIHH